MHTVGWAKANLYRGLMVSGSSETAGAKARMQEPYRRVYVIWQAFSAERTPMMTLLTSRTTPARSKQLLFA